MVVPKKDIEMYGRVLETLKSYNGKLSKNKKFNTIIEKLVVLLEEINEVKSQFEADISEYENKNNECRNDLQKKVVPVCRILAIYSFENKDKKTFNKYNLRKDEISQFKDMQLIKLAKNVSLDANKLVGNNLSSLKKIDPQKIERKYMLSIDLKENFGLTVTQVQEIDQSTGLFAGSMLQLDEKIVEKKQIYKKLVKKCIETDNLVQKKIDKYASYFEVEDESFYKKYVSAKQDNTKVSFKNAFKKEIKDKVKK